MAWTPFRSGQASRLAEPSGTARRGNSFPASRNGGPASGNASSRSPPVRRHGTQAMPPRIRTARRRGYPSCPDSWRHSLAIRRRRHLRATSCRMNRPTKPTPMTVPASQWRYSTSRSIIPLSPPCPQREPEFLRQYIRHAYQPRPDALLQLRPCQTSQQQRGRARRQRGWNQEFGTFARQNPRRVHALVGQNGQQLRGRNHHAPLGVGVGDGTLTDAEIRGKIRLRLHAADLADAGVGRVELMPLHRVLLPRFPPVLVFSYVLQFVFPDDDFEAGSKFHAIPIAFVADDRHSRVTAIGSHEAGAVSDNVPHAAALPMRSFMRPPCGKRALSSDNNAASSPFVAQRRTMPLPRLTSLALPV